MLRGGEGELNLYLRDSCTNPSISKRDNLAIERCIPKRGHVTIEGI